ncbi:MAG: terpene cyclase/mutase family protein [Planctomycetaceae bacterium]|nr:terpene cyclase/mutase family protein [Planctomycetaceae bacterium]
MFRFPGMTRPVVCALTAITLCGVSLADESPLAGMRARSIRFLRMTQAKDGSWTESELVGVTGLVTRSLLASGLKPDDPTVARGIANLLSHQKRDGGFYTKDSLQRNYETCITIMVLAAANEEGQYDERIKRAEGFLRELQWDQGEGIESSDPAWGGGGYGKHERPDLSNTQYLLEALTAAGVKSDDPAMQRIKVFVSRTQNFESEANNTPFAGKINDGGFYYTPAAGGESKAGVTEDGGLRSYGSMTYAGLKSLIYAGLSKDDPRIVAARNWIRQNYTLSENPGMGAQGLYYYFHTFGKTMDTLGDDEFVDAQGNKHDWKAELISRLQQLQRPNGSWLNPQDRWYEGDPNLVSAYCLLALSHCD